MKTFTFLLILMMGTVSCQMQAVKNEPTFAGEMVATPATSSNTLIIFFDPAIGKIPLTHALKRLNSTLLYEYKMLNGMAVKLPSHTDTAQAIADLKTVKGVLSVEQDQQLQLH